MSHAQPLPDGAERDNQDKDDRREESIESEISKTVEPSAGGEPSAGVEPSANGEPSAGKEPSAVGGSSAQAVSVAAPTLEKTPTTVTAKSPAPAATKPGARTGGVGLRLLAAFLFVSLVISGLALIEQIRIVSSLEAEVVSLVAELETSRAALGLYESRLESVKGEVANLAYSVGGLIELLNQDITTEAEARSGKAAEEAF